jgi:hypothetical protein
MTYQKPVIVAENKAEGTFAAGCPVEKGTTRHCTDSCEIRE